MRRYVDTDNAYVQQAKVSLSADVSGRVSSLTVNDNQLVKAGDVLFTQQAALLSYLDDFWLMAIVTLVSAPLVLLLRAPKAAAKPSVAEAMWE